MVAMLKSGAHANVKSILWVTPSMKSEIVLGGLVLSQLHAVSLLLSIRLGGCAEMNGDNC
jgi:hypothetical protein